MSQNLSEEKLVRLQDRVAIVTGGGSGIGRAIAQCFADEGAKVVVADRMVERAARVVAEIETAGGTALATPVEVTDAENVGQMAQWAVETYGQIDILVNNAAIAQGDDILTFDEATWDLNLDVVLKGVFLCSKAVLPAMIEARRGAIVNIASVNGLTGLGEEGYSAAKAGVINLTQNMAIKYGRHNVRANVICPGTVQTPIWTERLKSDPAIFDKLAQWYPLGRVGQPEDVAKAALYLASDDAAWVTGTVLTVDGGLMAGSYGMARALEGGA
ncbi:MAG TPA: glucose 1-dehydrogenase [Caldilineaceae bacterium]|nr:glucose 1-dehydrogenase [Caldilineaceae bacterium]